VKAVTVPPGHEHSVDHTTLCATGEADVCACGWWRAWIYWGRGTARGPWCAPDPSKPTRGGE
jgi:hypothetical protein